LHLSRYASRALIAGAITVAVGAPALPAAADPTGFHRVEYAGTSVLVPTSWPVIRLDDQPKACVRYDEHAVYLGAPSADQDCPAPAIGRSEAVLLEPATGTTPVTGPRENVAAQEIDRVAGTVHIHASYGSDRATAETIVASATPSTPSPAVAPKASRATPALASVGLNATNFTGKGFDPCTAPSSSAMNAWLASSYRALGVYIGGANRSCSQPNLTASYVSTQVANGWHFFLLYVGKQAPTTTCSRCSHISSPTADGVAEADDAASEAAALGFAPGSPIVFDLESYTTGGSATSTVISFLAAWTNELHAKGFASGVYSSSSSGIADLVAHYTTDTMPDVIDDALWNGKVDTADSRVPSTEWANHQRIHQYQGGHDETYGGTKINIDSDYLDVQLNGSVGVGPALAGRQLADLNHDGFPELVGRNGSGGLIAYPHKANTPAIAGSSWGATITIGGGWNQFDEFTFADLNNDGLPEIIARNPNTSNGALIVYPHKAGVTAIAPSSWDTPITVGSGWNMYDTIEVADINHDGLAELVGRQPDGTLKVYPHQAGVTAIAGTSWAAPVAIAGDWGQYDMISFADLDGDGLLEVLVRDPATNGGELRALPHTAGDTGFSDTTWGAPVDLSGGWNAYDTFATGDLDNDGLPEILVRNPNTSNGALNAFPHLANTPVIAGSSWGASVNIGTGWNTYNALS
jgi:hypothetical protein